MVVIIKLACKLVLQLWRANARVSGDSSRRACGSRVTSRDSPQWSACLQAIIKGNQPGYSTIFLKSCLKLLYSDCCFKNHALVTKRKNWSPSSLVTDLVLTPFHIFFFLSQQTCHARGCHATGGMAPVVLPRDNPQRRQQITENVCRWVRMKKQYVWQGELSEVYFSTNCHWLSPSLLFYFQINQRGFSCPFFRNVCLY